MTYYSATGNQELCEREVRRFLGQIRMQKAIMRILKASVLYFALVFGAGFVLGAIRTLWVVPRVGTRKGELMEMPIMLVVTIVAARWIVLHFAILSEALVRLGESAGSRSASCWSWNSASCSGCAACR